MKKILAFLILCFATLITAQTTSVSGTGVRDGTGAIMGSGTWCAASTCLSVSNGAFSGTVTSGTQTVTVVNSSSITVLTVPNVYISGLSFKWNSYIITPNAQITGVGTPYLPCWVGSTYTSSLGGISYCQSYSGQTAWGPVQSPASSGFQVGYGAPTFPCVSPCSYTRIDTSMLYIAIGPMGSTTSTWTPATGSGGGSADIEISDQSLDIGAAINAATQAALSNALGGHIKVSAGTYLLATEIHPASNFYYEFSPAANINAAGSFTGRLIHGQGTQANPLVNVHIHGGNFFNGHATATTVSALKDGIRCEWCNNLEIDHVTIVSVAGRYGIAAVNSNSVHIHDNVIPEWGYGAIAGSLVNQCSSGDPESSTCLGSIVGSSQDEWIERNKIGYGPGCINNNTSGLGTQCYGIAASASEDATPAGTNMVRVLDNDVTNVQRWECYDAAHGGLDILIRGNKGTNCYFGIQAGTSNSSQLEKLLIQGNYLDRGNGQANGYAIALAALGPGQALVHPVIEDNTLIGFGAGSTGAGSSVGEITLSSTINAAVHRNHCFNYYQACIVLYTYNLNPVITENDGTDVLGAYTLGSTALIEFASPGTWGAYINLNTIQSSSEATTPVSLVYAGDQATELDLGPNNNIEGGGMTTIMGGGAIQTALASGHYAPIATQTFPAQTIVDASHHPLNFKPGTVAYDLQYRPAFIFSSPTAAPYYLNGGGFYSMDPLDAINMTASISLTHPTQVNIGACPSPTSSATCGLGLATWWYYLPEGMNISIAGAGTGGAALLARVTNPCSVYDSYSHCTQLTIDVPAISAVNNATITWQEGTVTSLLSTHQWTTYIPGTLITAASANPYGFFNLPVDESITAIDLAIPVAPGACTTFPQISLTDGTTAIFTPLTGSTTLHHPVSYTYQAGATLKIIVVNSPYSCSVDPSDVQVTVSMTP